MHVHLRVLGVLGPFPFPKEGKYSGKDLPLPTLSAIICSTAT